MHYFYAGWLKLVGYLINILLKNKRVTHNSVINIPLNFVLFEKKKNRRSLINEKNILFWNSRYTQMFQVESEGLNSCFFLILFLSLLSSQLREKAYSKTKLLSELKYMYMHNSATCLWNSDIVLYHLHVKLYCNLWKLVFWH